MPEPMFILSNNNTERNPQILKTQLNKQKANNKIMHSVILFEPICKPIFHRILKMVPFKYPALYTKFAKK